jgi:hypothetical protein
LTTCQLLARGTVEVVVEVVVGKDHNLEHAADVAIIHFACDCSHRRGEEAQKGEQDALKKIHLVCSMG